MLSRSCHFLGGLMRRTLVLFLLIATISCGEGTKTDLPSFAPTRANATVVWQQTWESGFTDGDECTEILATDSLITLCREDYDPGRAPDEMYLRIKNAIPGYGGTFPSGSTVLLTRANAVNNQMDPTLGIGNAESPSYNGYIPADHWGQLAMFINNSGAETSVFNSNFSMKMVYPCGNVGSATSGYPCNTGSPMSYYYYLASTRKNNSVNPFCDTSLASSTNGETWIAMENNDQAGFSSASWAGWTGCTDSGRQSNLGQTNLSEWIKPGRWNIIKWHFWYSSGACNMQAWIGEMGSALTLVMDWRDGTTVEGSAFTWPCSGDGTHRAIVFPSTRPSHNTTGDNSWIYIDDQIIATSESDLPVYNSSIKRGMSGGVRMTGPWRIQ